MFKKDLQEACAMKEPFEFSYTKPCFDWYKTEKVSILYNQYNSLTLERRYGPSWWLTGNRFNKHSDKWEKFDIGEISSYDIRRLVEWARFTTRDGRKISILTEVRAIDTGLNLIDEFLKIMKSEG